MSRWVDLVGLARRFDRLLVTPGLGRRGAAGTAHRLGPASPAGRAGQGWLLASLLLAVALFALVPLVFVPRAGRG